MGNINKRKLKEGGLISIMNRESKTLRKVSLLKKKNPGLIEYILKTKESLANQKLLPNNL
jgi:hypothetical protein